MTACIDYTLLIETTELSAHLQDPTWAVIDCRFDLTKPDWGFADYQNGHIPGAVYAHLDHDLAGQITSQTGRHPLPSLEEMAARFSSWGIGPDTQVVIYDTTGGSFAGRLWWMLRFCGHQRVALLNGGLRGWLATGLPLTNGIEQHTPAVFISKPDYSMMASITDVERYRQDPAYKLIDARAAERFRGELEPIDPVAGHIPGAINRFHGRNLGPEGTFLPISELMNEFTTLLGDTPAERTIVYCGSGVTSCHHIIAMELAGRKGVKLYPGSWSEWIRDPDRPVAKG
jgi:thiosulfate/3-mercaptopyruvate sulfurtransferase